LQAHPDEKLGRACKPTQKKKKFLKMLQRSTKKTIKKNRWTVATRHGRQESTGYNSGLLLWRVTSVIKVLYSLFTFVRGDQ